MRPAPPGLRLLTQRQLIDERTLDELAAAEAAALGAPLQTAWVNDLGGLDAAVESAATADETLLVLPAPGTPDLGDLATIDDRRVLRLDVVVREPDLSPGLLAHHQGRGVWGIVWALRAAHHRRRWAVHTVRYGSGSEQFGELRMPAHGARDTHPIVVLLHGGFWRSCWQLDLMDAVSIDLADRGIASWNVEYRRPDRHGWDATVSDVREALERLVELRDQWPLDLDRVALVGHSAGGSLAVQAASDAAPDGLTVRVVVQLAGLVDLVGMHERDIGNGAVRLALGGAPHQVPQVYAQASPLERLPCGVPQIVVVGREESPDLREMTRRFVQTARDRRDAVQLIEDEGDHFAVIDPGSAIWRRTADAVTEALLV